MLHNVRHIDADLDGSVFSVKFVHWRVDRLSAKLIFSKTTDFRKK